MKSIRSIINRAFSEGRLKLYEYEAYEIAKAYSLPVPKAGLARTEDEAIEIAEKIGYPIVLKIISPDIIHKSDVGGVILNIRNLHDVRKGFREIMDNVKRRAPKARIVGILVQQMVPEGLEVIVGATRDPTFGPVVMFGLGGIFVEVIKDVSFRIAPLTKYDAESMLSEIKAAKILEGYRGMKPRDREALVNILLNVSRLMLDLEEIQDVDLNPIMSYEIGKGALIADIRMMLRKH